MRLEGKFDSRNVINFSRRNLSEAKISLVSSFVEVCFYSQ